MPPTEILQLLMRQAQVQGSRSTVLNPLGWLLAILLSTLVACQLARADRWISVGLAIGAGLTLAVYLVAYVYFALHQSDALRSERYSLSKMAIEKSVTGDNLAGFINPAVDPGLPPAIESVADKSAE